MSADVSARAYRRQAREEYTEAKEKEDRRARRHDAIDSCFDTHPPLPVGDIKKEGPRIAEFLSPRIPSISEGKSTPVNIRPDITITLLQGGIFGGDWSPLP